MYKTVDYFFLVFLIYMFLFPNRMHAQFSFVKKLIAADGTQTLGENQIVKTKDLGWLTVINEINTGQGAGIAFVKYNFCGDLEWAKQIVFPDPKVNIFDVIETPSQEFWVSIRVKEEDSFYPYLLKFSNDGALLLQKKIELEISGSISIQEYTDDKIGLTFNDDELDLFLSELDIDGVLTSTFKFSQSTNNALLSLIPDGKILLVFNREIILLDNEYNLIWSKTFNNIAGNPIFFNAKGTYYDSNILIPFGLTDGHQYILSLNQEDGSINWLSEPIPGTGTSSVSPVFGGNLKKVIIENNLIYCFTTIDTTSLSVPGVSSIAHQSILEASSGQLILEQPFVLNEVDNFILQDFILNTDSTYASVGYSIPLQSSLFNILPLNLFLGNCDQSIDFERGVNIPDLEIADFILGEFNTTTLPISDSSIPISNYNVEREVVCIENIPSDLEIIKDTILCPGDSLILDPEVRAASYEWSTGEDKFSIAIDKPGTYKLFMEQCERSLIYTWEVQENCPCDFEIPNVFTPNGDGINDFFRLVITDQCYIEDFNVNIFNRWGEKVFESTNVYFNWDGTLNGSPLPSDVLIYNITYQNLNANRSDPTILSGDVTLIR